MSKDIRVRFAPSPTGSLHLGGARTSIYNWLFAKSNNGKFLLRIEDTDIKRSQESVVDQIYSSLKWLGLRWDEKPVFQSRRLDIYRKRAYELINKGKAYRCFCTTEELETERKLAREKRIKSYKYSGKCRYLSKEAIQENLSNNKPYTIRFKLEQGNVEWKDLVYGKISVNNDELDDFIILRSNGLPTYQLAVVVDDIDMKITHVIRGEDHIPNTPKQINLFRAFNKEIPEFAHLPLLLGLDGKRLSKRHGATGIDEYREQGYLPEAVFNYLSLLGWAPKDGQEVIDTEFIIKQFSISDITKKPAIFDPKKLEWLSGQHLSRKSTEEIFKPVTKFLEEYDLISEKDKKMKYNYIIQVIDILKARVKTYKQFAEWGKYFFGDPSEYDQKTANKHWQSPEVNSWMKKLYENLSDLELFDKDIVEIVLRKTADSIGIKAAQMIHPLRLAITGFGIGPGVFDIVQILGKETVLRRIKNALEKLPIN
jgi:glutamyl-tRNA synthetase